MIKSSTIHLKDINKTKSSLLSVFCRAYRDAVAFYVKIYFSNTFRTTSDHSSVEQLKTPKFYPFDVIPKYTILSARALKCAKTQAMGIIGAATRKQQKRVYMLHKLNAENKDTKSLLRVINKTRLAKPKIPANLPAELNSIIMRCDSARTKAFDLAFSFGSLFNTEYKKTVGFNKFCVLAKRHKHFNSLAVRGTQMTSFLATSSTIQVRFELAGPEQVKEGAVLGVDQGAKTCISCSTEQGDWYVSGKCPHGWGMDSILKKLAKRTKGTKAFARAQAHRTNYINYCINRLNLQGIKELRLEEIKNIRKGSASSRFLSHFTYTKIENKLRDLCAQSGVRFALQSSPYRSQRCSSCGFVHVSNRKGKTFRCIHCSHTADADLNASANHAVTLPDLDRLVVAGLNKTTGFLWNLEFDGPYSAI
jgi:predicted RNA-binding Zn-ribbon protein involved in translation (DUF1610 family)